MLLVIIKETHINYIIGSIAISGKSLCQYIHNVYTRFYFAIHFSFQAPPLLVQNVNFVIDENI